LSLNISQKGNNCIQMLPFW